MDGHILSVNPQSDCAVQKPFCTHVAIHVIASRQQGLRKTAYWHIQSHRTHISPQNAYEHTHTKAGLIFFGSWVQVRDIRAGDPAHPRRRSAHQFAAFLQPNQVLLALVREPREALVF
jgi:hypothetical protein